MLRVGGEVLLVVLLLLWVQMGGEEEGEEGENVTFIKAAERGFRKGSVDMSMEKSGVEGEEGC